MSATSVFKMPASFARDNYPIVRDASSSGPSAEHRTVASSSEKNTSSAPARSEHQVTTEFRSLLGGSRRTATA